VPLEGLELPSRCGRPEGFGLMIGLTLPVGREPLRILCIGAHCDDIEIGCAGALLQLQKTAANLTIDWVVLTGEGARRTETTAAMQALVEAQFRGELVFGGFPDARLPAAYGELKDFFATLGVKFKPDLIFCHGRNDAHQDHRLVNEMTWGAFRDHLILEYEIVKWDGDLGATNSYVPLDKDVVDRKVDVLMQTYGSQRSKDWFTPETFLAIMRIRGVESRAPSGYAEAFSARKIVMPLRSG
jgi:LmbE family N-acetylglucosaminyl deacetylase